ncbi:MAG: hypothetical protein AAFQ12_12995 [Pseudomonadota bacterium]
MKRLITSFILLLFPLSAGASIDLAQQWGQEAGRLSGETANMMLAIDLGEDLTLTDAFALDVYRFGRTSADLAIWIDDTKGPNDLGCIFRGMAAESETQLETLETSTDIQPKRESLRRLASVFADAEMIAIAAQHRAPTPSLISKSSHATCSVDTKAVLDVLR